MSIEIDIQSGDASWPLVQPLFAKVWTPEIMAAFPGGPVQWANADLRVIIETPGEGAICHVGIYRRVGTWKGRKVRIGGIGGVSTHPDHRRHGYAGLALTAAIQTLRDERATDFILLVCEPHNVPFYENRGWHAFNGELYVEQKGERVHFQTMAPYIFDMRYGPRDGVIDLCGLPW